MGKLRIAFIGTGQIARVTHIANYQSLADVEIAAICDTNPEVVRSVAEQFHIPMYFTDHKEMLEKVKVDAVSVCVPNKLHYQIACDALEYGCHVFCEKPPAITVEEAKKMENKAKEKDKLLTFGFHFRHGSDVAFLKSKIDHGDFGNIYSARVQWHRRRGIPGWGSFTNKDIQGGGPLIDIGAHLLDLAVYLMDYPKIRYVSATAHDKIGKQGGTGLMGDWDPNKFTVEDSLFGFIVFENGASINLETSFAINIKEKDIRNVQLFGDKLGATVFPLEIFGEDGNQLINVAYPFQDKKDLYYEEVSNFINACKGKEALLVTARQAVYIQELICALYQSAEKGKPITFS